MRYLIWLILIAIPSITTAETISEYDGGSGAPLGIYGYGQSVLTPSGGPWTNITFGFLHPLGSGYASQWPRFGDFGSQSPEYAVGPLFVLTQEYTGLFSSLNQGVPGFLATGNTPSTAYQEDSGRRRFAAYWEFDNSLVLSPNTRYYFYSPQPLGGVGFSNPSSPFPHPDEEPTNQGYTTLGGGRRECSGSVDYVPNFCTIGPLFTTSAFPTSSTNYVLTGVVPEPETYAMLLAGLGLLGFAARRKA
jgi:hypothetical protein